MPNRVDARTRARHIVVAFLVLFCLGSAVPGVVAVGGPKVVIVVGPVGTLDAEYRRQAGLVLAEARRYTPNVTLVQSPRATWARVRAAARGASVFVFFGHGNGYPSLYGRFHGDTKNGLGLDPPTGANGSRHINYGEDRIRASIRFAPDAAVLLYRLCYASGNTEPGLAEGSTWQSKQRVDGYGAGFLAAGAGVVFAEGHPKSPADYIRQLFTTDRTMLGVFQASRSYHRHLVGPNASARTPGARYALDPDRGGADPSGFYRSVVGNLDLTTRTVTQRPPVESPSPTGTGDPASPPPTEPADPSASPAESPPPATASPEPGASAGPSSDPGLPSAPPEPPSASAEPPSPTPVQ